MLVKLEWSNRNNICLRLYRFAVELGDDFKRKSCISSDFGELLFYRGSWFSFYSRFNVMGSPVNAIGGNLRSLHRWIDEPADPLYNQTIHLLTLSKGRKSYCFCRGAFYIKGYRGYPEICIDSAICSVEN